MNDRTRMILDIEMVLHGHRPDLADEWRKLTDEGRLSHFLQTHYPRPDGWATMDITKAAGVLEEAIKTA